MDTIQNSLCENDKMQVLKFDESKPTKFRDYSHAVQLVEGLQSLRKNDGFCGIKLKTNDGAIVEGHKNVLVAASPYFCAIFSSFDNSNKEVVNIREVDSTVLKLLVDYIYTSKILITKENVQVLLPAACILQLDYVSTMCEDLMKTQLNPSNCLSTKSFAALHDCLELFSSSEAYIEKHFLEVIKCKEFLSLPFEEVVKLISCVDLTVRSEENVFECVIDWVKHELDSRKDFLTKLMKHVHLQFVPVKYILKRYYEETILNNSSQCKDYVIEAFHLHTLIKEYPVTIPKTIQNTSRQSEDLQKVVLLFYHSNTSSKCNTEWFDPKTKLRKKALKMKNSHWRAGLGVIRDQFVFAVGGKNFKSYKAVIMLNLSSKSLCWRPMANMLVSRKYLGVGVLNDCIYAIGGYDGTSILNTTEVFDFKEWRMIPSMSTKRQEVGIGVLKNRLYALGGWDGSNRLKSVECYDPTLNTWTPVVEMSVCRNGVGVGVLNGIVYAVGGHDDDSYLRSVEVLRPSEGVWSPIADMHLCRYKPGVIALNGLLYVMGGYDGFSNLDSIEIYNPDTNTWSLKSLPRYNNYIYGGVVVNKPPHIS